MAGKPKDWTITGRVKDREIDEHDQEVIDHVFKLLFEYALRKDSEKSVQSN
jgi:hypothetical protein